jgi:hypothetical protein
VRDDRGEASSPDRNIFSFITDLTDHVHKRVDSIERRLKTPTHPRYNSVNFPDNAAPGQVVRDINDMDAAWMYQENDGTYGDDSWHQIAGGELHWAFSRGTIGGLSNSTDLPLVPDSTPNRRFTDGSNYFGVPPVSIMLDQVRYPSIWIKKPGLYLVSMSAETGYSPADVDGAISEFWNDYLIAPRELKLGVRTPSGMQPAFLLQNYRPGVPDIVATTGLGGRIYHGYQMGKIWLVSGAVDTYLEMSIYDEYVQQGPLDGNPSWASYNMFAVRIHHLFPDSG